MSFLVLVTIAYWLVTRACRLIAVLTRLAMAVIVALLALALANAG